MLTGADIKFQILRKKVSINFLSREDQELKQIVKALLGAFDSSVGKSQKEIDENIDALIVHKPEYFSGLLELMYTRCEFEKDLDQIRIRRQEWIKAAQKLRSEKYFSDFSEFQANFEKEQGLDFKDIQKRLYGDLPLERPVLKYDPISFSKLVDRYNCAMIQGLLLYCNKLVIKVPSISLAEKRFLLRQIKFHQLLVEPLEESAAELCLEISGPLTLFSDASSSNSAGSSSAGSSSAGSSAAGSSSAGGYGLRMANFFPHLLNLPRWQLEAQLIVKQKECTLELNESVGISSHYKNDTSYIPKEFELFVEEFNQKEPQKYKAQVSSQFLHLGSKSYCFPDIEIETPIGKKIYVELFHQWHISTLQSRLQAVDFIEQNNLILGVCAGVKNKKEILKITENSKYFQEFGFHFKDFPLPSKVLALLKRFQEM